MSLTTSPVELENLWTVFGDQLVHQDISLSVARGESLALVGGSGSGKTTLLRQMLGLEKTDARCCALVRSIPARY